jgi:hypothetical protein
MKTMLWCASIEARLRRFTEHYSLLAILTADQSDHNYSYQKEETAA